MTVRTPSAALRRKAQEEINETPSRITCDIKALRDWLSQQPHLHSVKPSDQWLVAFLRGCKYNIEKAKGKIDMYYTLKATVPEFYENRDPLDPGIQEILKLGVLLPLRKCMYEDSPRIALSRVGPFCQTSRPLTDMIKVALMIVEVLLLEDDNFTIAGEDVVVDAKDVTFSLLWQWTPSMAMKVVSCAEKALSVRLKSVHFLNTPFFFGPTLRLFKMVLGRKIKNRIQSHSKDTLYDHIHKSVLPEEYGGTDGTVQELVDYWKTKVESYREWFVEENVCSDESKRPKIKNHGGIFSSVVRPFQSLQVDT